METDSLETDNALRGIPWNHLCNYDDLAVQETLSVHSCAGCSSWHLHGAYRGSDDSHRQQTLPQETRGGNRYDDWRLIAGRCYLAGRCA